MRINTIRRPITRYKIHSLIDKLSYTRYYDILIAAVKSLGLKAESRGKVRWTFDKVAELLYIIGFFRNTELLAKIFMDSRIETEYLADTLNVDIMYPDIVAKAFSYDIVTSSRIAELFESGVSTSKAAEILSQGYIPISKIVDIAKQFQYTYNLCSITREESFDMSILHKVAEILIPDISYPAVRAGCFVSGNTDKGVIADILLSTTIERVRDILDSQEGFNYVHMDCIAKIFATGKFSVEYLANLVEIAKYPGSFGSTPAGIVRAFSSKYMPKDLAYNVAYLLASDSRYTNYDNIAWILINALSSDESADILNRISIDRAKTIVETIISLESDANKERIYKIFKSSYLSTQRTQELLYHIAELPSLYKNLVDMIVTYEPWLDLDNMPSHTYTQTTKVAMYRGLVLNGTYKISPNLKTAVIIAGDVLWNVMYYPSMVHPGYNNYGKSFTLATTEPNSAGGGGGYIGGSGGSPDGHKGGDITLVEFSSLADIAKELMKALVDYWLVNRLGKYPITIKEFPDIYGAGGGGGGSNGLATNGGNGKMWVVSGDKPGNGGAGEDSNSNVDIGGVGGRGGGGIIIIAGDKVEITDIRVTPEYPPYSECKSGGGGGSGGEIIIIGRDIGIQYAYANGKDGMNCITRGGGGGGGIIYLIGTGLTPTADNVYVDGGSGYENGTSGVYRAENIA